MSNQTEEYEQHLHQQLRSLQESYMKAAEPILRELTRIHSMRASFNIFVRPEDLMVMQEYKHAPWCAVNDTLTTTNACSCRPHHEQKSGGAL